MAFFPQLVAGPIERAQRLLPQIKAPRTSLSYEQIRSGLYLILLGLVRKVVIADSMAPIVNEAFANADLAGAGTLLIGVIAFSLQIYGDFAGYSDIARGSSRLLGIELMENFNQPYLSRNITHFWRTWHISLSTWLRDYLYIPLGGNRKGTSKTYRNLMLTMLLGGLWHGAAWTFVVWGGLHGLYLIAHRRVRHITRKSPADPFEWSDLLPALATFSLVNLTWIFFRAETFTQAFNYLQGLLTLRPGGVILRDVALLLVVAAVSFALDLTQRNMHSHTALQQLPAVVRGLTYGSMALAVILWSGGTPVPFIYFQF